LRATHNENVTALFIVSKVSQFKWGVGGQGSAVKFAQCRKFLAEGKG